MQQTGKITIQSSVAYGGYATADDSAVITSKVEAIAHHIDPESYVSIFDKLWLFGLNGDDTVRVVGFVVLVLSGIAAALNIKKSIKAQKG